MIKMTGVFTVVAATLSAGAAFAQALPEAPAASPVVEQVDPTAAMPLIAPAPQLSGPAYDSRIRASLISAQTFQGPLDGGWRLIGPTGALYEFELVDRNNGVVEGAWRDLRRPGALGASGFVDAVAQQGAALHLSFDGGRTATLRPTTANSWTGEMDGQTVTLARRAP